jgi:hypothetical protein
MCMWVYVHSFPEGHWTQPKVVLDPGAVVTLQKEMVPNPEGKDKGTVEKIVQVTVDQGSVHTTNAPIDWVLPNSQLAFSGDYVVKDKNAVIPGSFTLPNGIGSGVQVLAPDVVVEGNVHDKFGVEGVGVALKPGVQIHAEEVVKPFDPAAFNPAHAKVIARSEKAKPMAVNMYSAFWTLLASVLVTVGVSLVTTPKPPEKLTNLVMGLTPIPDEGPCPWYEHPYFWAGVVAVVLVTVNIIFF